MTHPSHSHSDTGCCAQAELKKLRKENHSLAQAVARMSSEMNGTKDEIKGLRDIIASSSTSAVAAEDARDVKRPKVEHQKGTTTTVQPKSPGLSVSSSGARKTSRCLSPSMRR